MSFILDALKKSEAERQRQVGPTLLEVRITQPRRRLPLWALLVALLLGLNMLLLAYVLHKPAPDSPGTGGAAAGTAPAAAGAGAAPHAASALPAPSVAAPPAAATSAAAANPVSSPAGPASAGTQAGAAPQLPPPASIEAAAAAGRGYPDAAGEPQEDTRNPADEEPAVPPRRAANAGASASAKAQRADAESYTSWPSVSEVGGELPDLRLDLHVYAERPSDRYALINMHKVHEGDALPEGPRVIAITRAGVAMSYHGQNFMLHPQ